MSGPFPHRSFRWWAGLARLTRRHEDGFGSQIDDTTGKRHGRRLVAVIGRPR